MALALTGARGLFGNMQEPLHHAKGKRVTLTRGRHDALSDFRWLEDDLEKCLTCLYKLAPLPTTVDGYHAAYGTMCGGFLLNGPTNVPRKLQAQLRAALPSPHLEDPHTIIWCYHFPTDVVYNLDWSNPEGGTTNYDLDISVSFLHHDCVANFLM